MIINSLSYFDLVCYIIALCTFIPCWVFSVLAWQLLVYNNVFKMDSDSAMIEFFWTVIPAAAVIALCVMNLQFIVSDASVASGVMYKIVGHQWYWGYEDGRGGYYDSIMSSFVDGVNTPLRFVYGVPYKLVVTAADVIHSFTIPDYHVKVDAIPGRVNYGMFYPDRLGIFVGYCSELCGAGHAYMPIVIEVIRDKRIA